MKKTLIAATMCAALSAAQATVFYNEPFSYPDGDLTTQSGGLWVAHSGIGVGPVQVTSGQAILAQGVGSEDVNRDTGSVMGVGDIWYAGFDVTVTGSAAATTTYFAHFLQSSSIFGGRVFVTAPTSGGDFAFGLSGGSSSVHAVWATDGTYGTSYHLVVSYAYDTGDCNLWVDPTDPNLVGDTYISDTGFAGDTMYGFALRQSSGNTTEAIDNLVVYGVPEPGTLGLFVLGGLSLLGLKMRRS